MRAATSAIALFSLLTTLSVQADFKPDAVGGGYWFGENGYVEIYHETELGLHPQVFIGPEIFGASVKTNPLYSKYQINLAPFFGFGVSEDNMEGLIGVEADHKFNIQSHQLDAYFRLNTDFDLHKDYMMGVRYFF
jgi:hypothetical protein